MIKMAHYMYGLILQKGEITWTMVRLPHLYKVLVHQHKVLTQMLIKTRKTSGLETCPRPPLTNTQEKVLARGPNFTIVPKVPPVIEYVAAIEKACQQLKQGEVEELRGEIKSIIKKIHPANLTSQKKNTKPYNN